jgi:hypothetical protein
MKFELAEAEEVRQGGGTLTPILHRALADCLRWCAGDPGTQYERIMRERNHADLGKMPAGREVGK